MTDEKQTPLEALASRISPITDVVYGSDHPAKKPSRAKKSPPQKAPRGGTTIGDSLPADTRRKLSALQGKLEAAQRRMKKGGTAS